MARVGIPVGFFCVMLLSCGCGQRNGHRAAREMDQRFCAINDGVFGSQRYWRKAMAYAISSGNYAPLHQARILFSQNITDAIRAVNDIPDTLQVQDLKEAELALLGFEKTNTAQSLQPFEKLKANTPMKELSVLVEKLRQSEVVEKSLTEKLNAAQDKFCDRNEIRFSARALGKAATGATDSTR
jgi:hypothetical protein